MVTGIPGLPTLNSLVNKTITWSFDAYAGTFRNNATGLLLPPSEVRKAVDAVVEGARMEAGGYVATLAASRGDGHALHDFEVSMLGLIAALHYLASVTAYGGVPGLAAQLTADLRRVQARERNYLAGFVAEIRRIMLDAGGPLLALLAVMQNQALWSMRAGSYVDSAIVTYERHRLMLHIFVDYAEARRVLRPGAESCAGCVAHARESWVPIARLVPLGTEECGQWCKCDVEYRRAVLAAALQEVAK